MPAPIVVGAAVIAARLAAKAAAKKAAKKAAGGSVARGKNPNKSLFKPEAQLKKESEALKKIARKNNHLTTRGK